MKKSMLPRGGSRATASDRTLHPDCQRAHQPQTSFDPAGWSCDTSIQYCSKAIWNGIRQIAAAEWRGAQRSVKIKRRTAWKQRNMDADCTQSASQFNCRLLLAGRRRRLPSDIADWVRSASPCRAIWLQAGAAWIRPDLCGPIKPTDWRRCEKGVSTPVGITFPPFADANTAGFTHLQEQPSLMWRLF